MTEFKGVLYGISVITNIAIFELFQKLPNLLIFFLLLMLTDILLGTLQALKNKKVSTKKIYNGGLKKITILIVITISYFIDLYLLNNPAEYIFNSTILYYSFLELLSVSKNANKLGVKLPKAILQVIENLREKE